MPYQNNRRRRERLRDDERRTPPDPNPPQSGLIARYLSGAVRGVANGQPVPQPPDGPLAAWAPIAGTFEPLRAIDAAHVPELVTDEESGLALVMLDPGEVMVSSFSPPGGSAARTLIFVGFPGEDDGRVLGYGAPSALRSFSLVVTGGEYGWDLGADPQPSGAATDDHLHAISLFTDGAQYGFSLDDEGTEPMEAALDTSPSWLTLGSPGASLAVLELLVYDHLLDDDENAELRDYLAVAYGIGEGGVPETGLRARFRAEEVSGPEGALPSDSTALAEWVQSTGDSPPFAQSVALDRPLFLLRNGRPRVRFDPSKTMSVNPDMPGGDLPRSLVLMGVNWHPDADQILLSQGDGAVGLALFALATAPSTGRAAAALDDGTFVTGDEVLDTSPHTLIACFDGSVVTFQIDDNDPVTLATDLATSVAGVVAGGDTAAFDAYEVLMYDRGLVGADRDRILAYAAEHYPAQPVPSFPSGALLMDWRASSINGLDSVGVVKALGASGQRQFLRPHKSSTTGSFVQNTALERPEFFNDNLPFIRFGSGQSAISPTLLPSGTADRTIVLIAMMVQAPNQRLLHYGDMSTDGAGFGLVTDGSGSLRWSGGGAIGGNIGQTSDGGLHVIIVTVGSGGTQVTATVDYNAAIVFNGLSLNTVSDPITLGDSVASPQYNFVHLMAFTSALGNTAKTQVVDFSHDAYGAPSH